MTDSGPVTICITRNVRRGCEAEFERALHEFVQQSLLLPGQQGVHVMRPAPGSNSREYGIVRKFASRAAVEAFRESPEYRAWTESVSGYTEGGARTEELSGLESWFTLPGEGLHALPKWKMAVATFVGVFPTASLLGVSLGPAIASWNPLLRNLLFNACMVALLTWIVMPLVTRMLHGWIHAGETGRST